MSDQVPLRCTCGKVRGVAQASPDSGSRIVCYCEDCRAFARFLERADVLDPHGGSDIFQMPPSAVRITDGIEHVQCLRLSEKGMIRWYTDCCRSPIGNTMGGGVPFIGLLDSFMDPKAEGRSLDEVIGKPLGAIHGREAVGGMPEGAHPKVPLGLMLRSVRKLGGWWLRGKGHPSPFFDAATKAPRVPPRILTIAERNALRQVH